MLFLLSEMNPLAQRVFTGEHKMCDLTCGAQTQTNEVNTAVLTSDEKTDTNDHEIGARKTTHGLTQPQ